MLVEILIVVIMIIVSFILYKLATTSPLGWHPPHVLDNTDTQCWISLVLYLEDQHWQQTVLVFLDFYVFVLINLPMCQSVCVSLGLFAVHLKFLKTCYDEVSSDLSVKKW